MITVRISFTKTGEASYISLLDLQRVMHRSLKRSGLPVWYTMGFNPHIYLTFACPLPLGQESLVECVDCKTEDEAPDYSAWKDALNKVMPTGIVVTNVAEVVQKADQIGFARYEIICRNPGMADALQGFNGRDSAPVQKKSKRGMRTLELKELIETVEYQCEGEQCRFELLLPASESLNVNPSLLLRFLQDEYRIPTTDSSVLRTAFLTKNMEDFR